ncbi:unnamed protein product [Adineta steineri]|uniref:Uncharacterized protein n=1 Tax=Adineta steineri TaxID=433720 RepID=A0A819L6Y1_9BILA|nr:unnamed protein product [Adineta steineri]CAF3961360.1 unnamed protein product [Adineta steineri]
MAQTNNPQIFLNRLTLGQVSDFVTDLLPPGRHFNLVNKDHFNSPSITMKQLTKMKNARGEQHLDGEKRVFRCEDRNCRSRCHTNTL